jgi:hypothetical protein
MSLIAILLKLEMALIAIFPENGNLIAIFPESGNVTERKYP